ncbi:MAG TPA: hypothetical protein VMV76_05640 [Dehalococcoidia bacterium]|nr:hypothetical protein [Dehalococcoidia bacterium]
MNNTTLSLIEAEKKAKDITTKNHPEVFELVEIMMHMYISGFNLIGNSRIKRDTDRAWSALIIRSYHSLICSVELMGRGYYAQSMALIRMVVEAYFLCGNCEKDKTIVNAVVHNKSNRPNGKTIFNYKKLAIKMGDLDWYNNDYVFACHFSHMSHLTLEVMTTEINPDYRSLKIVPSYDELSFIACCKLLLRNGLLMTKFLGKLLDNLSKENANAWHIKATTAVEQAQEWLDGLKGRYGNR